MSRFMRCRLCGVEISPEECLFAVHSRAIDGKEYRFCCERHAKEFEKKLKTGRERTAPSN
ncbi:MAG: hypothetical protein ACE5Z5_03595 [Candidatus Bathyarchaeia archaeon]